MYKLLIIFVCSIAMVSAASAQPDRHRSDPPRGPVVGLHSDSGRPGPSNQGGAGYHPSRPSGTTTVGYSGPTGSWLDQARAGSSYHTAQTASVSYGTSSTPSSSAGGSRNVCTPTYRTISTTRPDPKPSDRRLRHDSSDTGYRPSGSDSRRDDRYSPAVVGDRYSPTPGGYTRLDYRPRPPAPPRPTSYKPPSFSISYAKAHYTVPHGYVPPVYRSGCYYYPTRSATKGFYFGFWSFDYDPYFCTRSVYFYYGLLPYVQISRVEVVSPPTVVYVQRPIYTGGVYYTTSSFSGLDSVLADIRCAWISGRYDLIERHVWRGYRIAVFLDGRYDYSIASDDYLSMTRDALGNLDTVSFVWDSVKERADGQVTAFGAHVYRVNGETHTVYISYTLRKSGTCYYITEVGSSDSPLD